MCCYEVKWYGLYGFFYWKPDDADSSKTRFRMWPSYKTLIQPKYIDIVAFLHYTAMCDSEVIQTPLK